MLPEKENCELALEGRESQETFNQISMLMDDEDLELRELEGVPDPPGCSGHSSTNAHQGCSLCKGRFQRKASSVHFPFLFLFEVYGILICLVNETLNLKLFTHF